MSVSDLVRQVTLPQLMAALQTMLQGATDGTAALPGFAFASDPSTGVFKRTDGGIGLAVKGASTMGVDAEGVPRLTIQPAAPGWTQAYDLAALLGALPLTATLLGAKGDGVTDDTAPVLSAMAQGARYVPPGIFLVTSLSVIQYMTSWYGPGSFLYNGTQFPAGDIVQDMVVNVPSVLPTIQAAVTFAESKAFRGGGGITIQIANGTYACEQISPRMADGANRLSIVGNQANEGVVILNFDATNNQCGFLVNGGNGIAWLNGFTIQGVGGMVSPGVWNAQCYGGGVVARFGSLVSVGPQVRVNYFYYGVQSQYGSSVTCASGGIVFQSGDCGYVSTAATLQAQGCQVISGSHLAASLGSGFRAEESGYLDCDNAGASYCNVNGFIAQAGQMSAKSATANNNGGPGFFACYDGQIDCSTGTGPATNSYQNGGQGYYAFNRGFINGNSSLSTLNGLSGYQAENLSLIDITASNSSHNKQSGYAVVGSSSLSGNAPTSFENVADGFNAGLLSTVRTANSVSNSNGGQGYFAQGNSIIDLITTYTAVNNTGGPMTPALNTTGNNGAYILQTS